MASYIRRREFLATLSGAVVAWPLAARAQQTAMPVIGSLQGVAAAQWAERIMAGFHRGLSETGYVEGRNVAIEYRWAEGQLDRLPAMAADLVSRRVAVIFATPDVGVRAAMPRPGRSQSSSRRPPIRSSPVSFRASAAQAETSRESP